MAPFKFVIKCGNFAVLVDLHVLPLGGREDASWFTTDHIEEVTALVRDAVDQRVKQYTDILHNRKQTKQKKELAPAVTLTVKGNNFNLAANFLKRHSNLRCVVKQLYGDLRVFPERYVVCVRRSEDASALHGNPSLAAAELLEQSRSEYFSRAGETQELLNSATKTKKTKLQKIAKQAGVQREICVSSTGEQLIVSQKPKTDWRQKPSDAGEDLHPQRAKRTCLGSPPAMMQTHSSEGSTQTSKHDPLPLQPLPPAEAKAQSKAFPVSECSKTTLEVELLTPGKRAQRLPLTSNNTAQTNQNRLAASLRGLSVKPASSGSSISSRSTLREEGSENVPRTSRLRRQKRS
ncbi:protein SLX4IP [Xyrichtys novacula]|uniref:Protein SLX4IP n=1 Tax=Xyrichtys novacula TaxID=13765 RepID=A0AAV1G2Z4_XYRNO|nr:protein SLX4IP [Xyrichtys novacula]